MNKRTPFLLMAVLVLVLTSLAAAQMGSGMGRSYGMGPGWGSGGPGYMASSLNLTDAQKQKAQSIFDSAHQQAQTLRDQMYEKRKAYWNSQKPMSDAEIDKLAAERGELSAKMQATREKAFANFYNNVLTAEQRTKYDQLRASAGPGPGMGGRGRGFCPRGRDW